MLPKSTEKCLRTKESRLAVVTFCWQDLYGWSCFVNKVRCSLELWYMPKLWLRIGDEIVYEPYVLNRYSAPLSMLVLSWITSRLWSLSWPVKARSSVTAPVGTIDSDQQCWTCLWLGCTGLSGMITLRWLHCRPVWLPCWKFQWSTWFMIHTRKEFWILESASSVLQTIHLTDRYNDLPKLLPYRCQPQG